MHLLIQSNQRDDGWFESSITFIVYAHVELTPEENELAAAHQLFDLPIYDSEARLAYAEKASEHFDNATQLPSLSSKDDGFDLARGLWHVGGQFYNLVAGATNAIFGATSLQITLESLTHEQNIESQSLEEIEAVKDCIKTSLEYLANYMNVSLTYDGREQLDEY